MKHTTSKILLSVLLLSTAGQLAISVPVFADTFTGNGSGGTWGDEDGATDVSTIVLSSYTVRIPATLDLPTTDTYTTQSDNVEVLSGAHIPSNQSITVKLGAGQTFSAANGENDAVAYKVKLADGTKLTGTTGAYEILKVGAETAHQTGGTTSVNVGFDTSPDYKFAGIYTDHVQFEVSTPPAPVPSTGPVVLNDDGTVTFADETWQILVDGNTDEADETHAGDYLVIRKNALTNREAGEADNDEPASKAFGTPGTTYFNSAGTNGYQISGLKTTIDNYAATILANPELAKGVLPVNLNDMTFEDFIGDGNPLGVYPLTPEIDPLAWFTPPYERFAQDVRGATTVDEAGSRQAFALSYGDIHTIDQIGPTVYGTDILSSPQGLDSWTRSPGSRYNEAGYMDAQGLFNKHDVTYAGTYAIRPAFWLTTN